MTPVRQDIAMSLFENRSDFGAPEDHPPDVVHLGSHGCDALFSRYSGGTHTGPSANSDELLPPIVGTGWVGSKR